jgi:hypothetical protein
VTESRPWSDWAVYHKHLRIEDRASGLLVPLVPNAFQRRIRAEIVRADRERRPARLMILKSRRMGSSTLVQATLAHRAFTRPRYTAVTIAHDDDSAGYLHEMASTMWEELPESLKKLAGGERVGVRGKRLSLGNGSTLRTQTAKNTSAGRSKGARALHASEVAYYDDGAKALVSVKSIVPNEPGTLVVLESTANGVGGAFHSEWLAAEAGETDFVALFAAWFEFDPYGGPGSGYEAVGWGELGELDDEERALRAGWDLPAGRLAWRRWAIANLCGGDIDVFHAEYPSTAAEAFVTSGRTYFKGLDNLRRAGAPLRRGVIEGQPYHGGGELRFVDDPKGPLRVYELPQRDGRRYVVFVDPIGDDLTVKEVGSFKDKREAKDYACMQVVDCSTGTQVAEWHARLDSDLLGVEAARLGYLYGKAKIAPEMTGGYGQKTLDALLRECGYGNVYITEEANTVDRKQTRRWGWYTSSISRREMLDALKVVIRERPDCIRSKELVDEMRSFVINDRGKAAAAAGTYDDRVMAMAGAHALYLRNVQSVQRLGEKRKRVRPQRAAILENAPRV